MSKPESRALTTLPRVGLIGVVVVAIVALAAILTKSINADSKADRGTAGAGLSVTLSVEPFDVSDSVPATWNSSAFAESLASRLSQVPGLRAMVAERTSHYALRGSVAMKEGRLILATRLSRDTEQDTLWTATFWRSSSASATLLSDLASAVAEAAINTRVQESLSLKRDKP